MVDWPLTFRCNNNCISCINNTAVVSRKKDPPWEQIKNVIDSLDPERDYLGLSGGEPTLRGDIVRIIKYARDKFPDLYIFLVSNGRMFSYEDFAKKVVEAGKSNFMIGIALYGHNSALHDSITRSDGSFSQAVSGIKNLLKTGARVEVRVVINRMNYKNLEEITEFVTKELSGVERMVFVNMKITGNAYKNRENVAVKISDVVPFAKKAVALLAGSGIETRLYHFPLCTVPRDIWSLAEGVTKHDIGELTFTDVCNSCSVRSRCCKIWTTYLGVFGGDEFVAIEPTINNNTKM